MCLQHTPALREHRVSSYREKRNNFQCFAAGIRVSMTRDREEAKVNLKSLLTQPSVPTLELVKPTHQHNPCSTILTLDPILKVEELQFPSRNGVRLLSPLNSPLAAAGEQRQRQGGLQQHLVL